MYVLMSIKPKYVEKILSGEKKYEYRKTLLKKDVESILVYSTSPVKKVVCEIKLLEVVKGTLEYVYNKTNKESGITLEEFNNYFKNKSIAYAYKLGSIKKLDLTSNCASVIPIHRKDRIMKVIFLDVDGVLNNDGYFERTKNEKQNRIELDDENIKCLKEIIDLTGAKVVVTSTWKELRIYNELISYLKNFGIEVYDKTVHMSYNRGDEIREYLSTHEIDNFIILDDEIFKDFNELISHLVKTDFYNGGLTEKHKTLALKLMNN